MHNKLSLICVVVLMVSAGSVFAGLWTGGAGTSNWNDGANWEEGYAPTATTAVYLDATGLAGRNPFIDGVAGFASVGLFGDAIGRDPNPSGPFMLSVKNGGSLTVVGDAYLGMGGTAAILDVSGAGSSVSVGTNNASSFLVAHSAPGTINQTGGTVSCTQTLFLGWDGVSDARYNLNGGQLLVGNISMNVNTSIMDIAGGTMILNGDDTATVAFLAGSGAIKAHNGLGVLMYDYNVTTPGKTTVWAELQTNLAANGSFEVPDVPSGNPGYQRINVFGGVQMPGWFLQAGGARDYLDLIDAGSPLWGGQTTTAADGHQFIQLYAQTHLTKLMTALIPGTYTVSFDYTGKVGQNGNEAAVAIGYTKVGSEMKTFYANEIYYTGTNTAANPDWQHYEFVMEVPEGNTETAIEFFGWDGFVPVVGEEGMWIDNVHFSSCVFYLAAFGAEVGDISGPAGTPDCRVNFYDFAALAENWLNCYDPDITNCR